MATDINSLWAYLAADYVGSSYRAELLAAGANTLVSVDVPKETIAMTAGGIATLTNITGGRAGQFKVLVADDANVTIVHNAANFVLKGAADLPMQAGDILILVNRGGDPATVTNGYWREVSRTLF
jgi:hypothetical protein